MDTLKRLKMLKNIVSFIPIALIVGGLVYLQFRGDRIESKFYEANINSIVVERSDWQKRSIDFYLDNKMTLNFLAPVEGKIMVGDSIKKMPNTYSYSVYRKDLHGNYKLFATYDYRKKY